MYFTKKHLTNQNFELPSDTLLEEATGIYIYLYLFAPICTYLHLSILICAYLYLFAHICTYLHLSAFISTFIYLNIRMNRAYSLIIKELPVISTGFSICKSSIIVGAISQSARVSDSGLSGLSASSDLTGKFLSASSP